MKNPNRTARENRRADGGDSTDTIVVCAGKHGTSLQYGKYLCAVLVEVSHVGRALYCSRHVIRKSCVIAYFIIMVHHYAVYINIGNIILRSKLLAGVTVVCIACSELSVRV